MPSKRTLKRMCKGSPGLVVTGGDSCSNGCEFESQLVPYLFVVKFVMCVWKVEKMKKWAGIGPFLKKGSFYEMIFYLKSTLKHDLLL